MRPKFRLFLIVTIALLLAACEPGIIDIATNTPGVNDPTPTQEAPTPTPRPNWDVSCIRETGAVPITERPCPVDTISPMEFAAYPSMNYPDYSPTITCDNGCSVWLHDPGNDGKGRAGRAAIQMHNVQLNEGQLYIAQFNVNLNLQNANEGNYSIGGAVHTDSGNVYPLREHGITKFIDNKFTINGVRNTWSCIRPQRDMTVVVEEWIEALWAGYVPGNNYEVLAIYVYETNNINLCGNVIVID